MKKILTEVKQNCEHDQHESTATLRIITYFTALSVNYRSQSEQECTLWKKKCAKKSVSIKATKATHLLVNMKKREKQTNTNKQQRNYHHVKWFNEYNFISLLICRFCRENLNNIKCMFSDLSHSLSCNFISFFGCITFHILLLNINSCNSFIRRAWSKGKKYIKKLKNTFLWKKKSAQQTFDPCL